MPNLEIGQLDKIREKLQEIIENPGDPDNQRIFDEITGAFTYLGSVDDRLKHLYEAAKAALQRAQFPDMRF